MPEDTHDLILKTRLQIIKSNLERIRSFKSRMADIQAEPESLEEPSLCDDIRRDLRKIKAYLDPGTGIAAVLVELETLVFQSTQFLKNEKRGKVNVSPHVADALSRLEEAGRQLERLDNTLNSALSIVLSMTERCVPIEVGVAKKAAESLEDEAGICINAIDRIRTKQDAQDKGDFDDASAAWTQYANEVYGQSQNLFREYVDFLGGLAMRDTGLDEGICQLADELLSGFDVRDVDYSLAIPTRHEAVTKTLSRIIRLGFPEWSIWALPLTAHELGRVIVESQKDMSPYVNKLVEQSHAKSFHIETILADAIATLMTGPAYACAAVLLRFDPLSQDSPDGYPADSKRAYAVFSILKWMNERKLHRHFAGVIEKLEQAWNVAMKHAGATQVTDDEKRQFETWLQPLKEEKLLLGALSQMTYLTTGWGDVLQLAEKLVELEGPATKRLKKNSILNAAWMARLQHPESIAEIASATKQLFRPLGDEIYGTRIHSAGDPRTWQRATIES